MSGDDYVKYMDRVVNVGARVRCRVDDVSDCPSRL